MMENARQNLIHKINYLMQETDAIYHQAALKLKISDSVSNVLYAIYDIGPGCLLSDVYKSSGISRQTVNSAIRSLEAADILYLEPYRGRAKRIVLTEKGTQYIEETAAKLFAAETAAFDSWTEEEISTHLRLIEKYTACFRREIEKL